MLLLVVNTANVQVIKPANKYIQPWQKYWTKGAQKSMVGHKHCLYTALHYQSSFSLTIDLSASDQTHLQHMET